jgi:hypothetical protein
MNTSTLAAGFASAWIVAVSAAHAGPLEFVRSYSMSGSFVDDTGKPATDISGFACTSLPAHHCLAINDENRTAQFATLEDGRIVPQSLIKLIGDGPSPTTLGKVPKVKTCQGKTKFKDLDGEAVAYAAPYFYVVGSHGCGRRHGAFHPSSFILARIRVDGQCHPIDAHGSQLSEATSRNAVETTYRISDLLQRPSAVSPFFGKPLDEASDGLNIEGLAVVGDKLFVGLRAPSLDGKAYILGASVADLFAPGNAPAAGKPEVIAIQLGPKTSKIGIRDLAPYKDRLLVLAGPAQQQADVS